MGFLLPMTPDEGTLISVGSQPVVENTEMNVFEKDGPASTPNPSAAQDDTATGSSEAGSASDSTSDLGQDDSFAQEDGGDFFGGDDSYV